MIPPNVIAQAIKLLQGKITPRDIDTIKGFSQMVAKRRAGGELGDTGTQIQSLVDNIFGKQYGHLSNPVVKRALDLVVQGVQR